MEGVVDLDFGWYMVDWWEVMLEKVEKWKMGRGLDWVVSEEGVGVVNEWGNGELRDGMVDGGVEMVRGELG